MQRERKVSHAVTGAKRASISHIVNANVHASSMILVLSLSYVCVCELEPVFGEDGAVLARKKKSFAVLVLCP